MAVSASSLSTDFESLALAWAVERRISVSRARAVTGWVRAKSEFSKSWDRSCEYSSPIISQASSVKTIERKNSIFIQIFFFLTSVMALGIYSLGLLKSNYIHPNTKIPDFSVQFLDNNIRFSDAIRKPVHLARDVCSREVYDLAFGHYLYVCLFSLTPKFWLRQSCRQSCLSSNPPPVLSVCLAVAPKGIWTHPKPLSKGTCSKGLLW